MKRGSWVSDRDACLPKSSLNMLQVLFFGITPQVSKVTEISTLKVGPILL